MIFGKGGASAMTGHERHGELRNRGAYPDGDGIDREMLIDVAHAQLSTLDWLTAIAQMHGPTRPGRDHHG